DPGRRARRRAGAAPGRPARPAVAADRLARRVHGADRPDRGRLVARRVRGAAGPRARVPRRRAQPRLARHLRGGPRGPPRRRPLGETRAFRVAAEADRIQPRLWPHVPAEYRPDLRRVTLLVSATGLVQTPFFLFGSDLAQDVYGWDGLFTAIVMASGLATFA